MEAGEWLRSIATGKGRPEGAAALEAYRNYKKAEKERDAALRAAGAPAGAFAPMGADVPMNMAP
eukprot:724518-Prymnesium_polylepis.1